jgi:ribosome-binding protein aMBF1 (putative translation factor)
MPQNLENRNRARRAQLLEDKARIVRELAMLDALRTLKTATQYAIDFANPGEAVISREELAHDMAEDLSLALEIEEGEVARLIEEAIAAGELESGGEGRILIPFRTWRKAGFNC